MNYQYITGSNDQVLAKRLHQVLWGSQIAFLFAATINFFPKISSQNEGFDFNVAAFLFAVVTLELFKRFAARGHLELVGKIYIVMMITFAGIVGWSEGGMLSVAVFVFPLLGMLTMVFSKLRFALVITAYIFSIIVFFGVSNAYDWYAPPTSGLIDHSTRVGGAIGVLIFSVFFGWIFGQDIRKAYSELSLENNRVLEAQGVIQKLAETDSLTGLFNRSAAQTRFDSMVANLGTDGRRIGFYFIDLDNFKVINDVFDHHQGDLLLKTISNRLSALVGPLDAACRLGGDEFVVLFKGDDNTDFESHAQNIIKSIASPYYILGAQTEVTASIGISIVSKQGLSFDEVRKQADMAMYKAKQLGKNNYHYYSAELHQEYMRNINIVEGLKDALSQNLLDLRFQPKVNLATDKVSGVEALLRWNRVNPQDIRPDEFIPVIESTELLHEIGAWIIQESCRQCKAWHDDGYKISMAVNVSALQLSRAGFCTMVSAALKSSGLEAKYLEIEITEHFHLKDSEGVKSRIQALKGMGVRMAIDDFGTGYSNMNYLTRLKVDVLKLDQSFISPIGNSEESLVLVKAIIEMARVLKMEVVAEGVESAVQRDTLKALGCDIGQGFLWSRALSPQELIPFLDDFSNINKEEQKEYFPPELLAATS